MRTWVPSLASLRCTRTRYCCKLWHRYHMRLGSSIVVPVCSSSTPSPGNFHMPQSQPWTEKEKEKTTGETKTSLCFHSKCTLMVRLCKSKFKTLPGILKTLFHIWPVKQWRSKWENYGLLSPSVLCLNQEHLSIWIEIFCIEHFMYLLQIFYTKV